MQKFAVVIISSGLIYSEQTSGPGPGNFFFCARSMVVYARKQYKITEKLGKFKIKNVICMTQKRNKKV